MNTQDVSKPSNTSVTPGSEKKTINNKNRKHLLILVLLFILLALIAGWIYWEVVLKNFVSTDDAYVAGNVVQITPQINGTIVAIEADDTEYVEAGKRLLRMDSADANIALANAEAELAQAVRQVRTLYANNKTLAANVNQRNAEVKRAESVLNNANEDYQRRAEVIEEGAISGEELQHAKHAQDDAANAYFSAKAIAEATTNQLAAGMALTDGTSVEKHPNVKQAAIKLRNAFLNKTRCEIISPVSGMVGKRSVQLGQHVMTSSPLMAVVQLDQVWVDANFKESQLSEVRIGQPVELEADIYGSKIKYKGSIEGFGAATGSVFSLLPAQNANGNWIKIVQRLPVRIALDKEQIKLHPLRIGLSMNVEVDVHNRNGKLLNAFKGSNNKTVTTVFDQNEKAAQQLVDRVIDENLGKKVKIAPAKISKPRQVEALPV